MNDAILSANLRNTNPKLAREAYMQSVDNLLFEATMEAEAQRREHRQERGQSIRSGLRR